MLTEDDEKEDIVVFVPKGRNAESYKDIAREEIGSLTQMQKNCVLFIKNILAESNLLSQFEQRRGY